MTRRTGSAWATDNRAGAALGSAYIGLGLATFVAIALMQPAGSGPEAAYAAFGWFLGILIPGAVTGILGVVAGIIGLGGHRWGRRLGIISVVATILWAGGLLLLYAPYLGESFSGVGSHRNLGLVTLAALTTLAIATLTMDVTHDRRLMAVASAAPIVMMLSVYGWHELSMQPGCPAVARTGASGKIVFIGRAALCLSDQQTGDVRLVYASPERMESEGVNLGKLGEPALSPDGQSVAFIDDGRLSLIPTDGGIPRTLALEGSNPAWSPDGKRIAYDVGGDSDVLDVATGESQVLFADSGDANWGGHPSWSPDGSQVVLSRDGRLWLVGADGIGWRPLTPKTAGSQVNPAWSPDGSMIAFTNSDIRAGGPSETTVFIVRSDGSDMRKLVDPPWGAVYVDPTWAPDSMHIAFVSLDSNRPELRIVQTDGLEMRPIANDGRDPAWQG